MDISFRKIIPFPINKTELISDIWKRDIYFSSPCKYLISASSGKGKTSLLSIIFGLRKDYEGSFFIDNLKGNNISQKKWTEIRREKLSLVPQGLWLFENLSGYENILLKNNLTSFLDKDTIDKYLKKCGMYEHSEKKAGKLSYGQKQRIAIIRSLCQPFEFLLLDEAFSHLDKENKNIMTEIIYEEAEKRKAGIIITSLGENDLTSDKTLKL